MKIVEDFNFIIFESVWKSLYDAKGKKKLPIMIQYRPPFLLIKHYKNK
jgi:hypothetical protein